MKVKPALLRAGRVGQPSLQSKNESLNELCILLYLHEVEGHMIQGRINTASLGTMNSDSVKNKIKIQFCSSLTPL